MSAVAHGRAPLWSRSASVLAIALTGRETRYVGRLYAERVFIFVVLILAVVLSLDAARNLNRFMAEQPLAGEASNLGRFGYYLFLRAGYNLPAILPIATWIGVIWAEFTLANSRQRIMIFNSGRPPLRSLAPALVVGLALGAMQFASLAYVRPASVEGQAVSGFRYYGPKFAAPAESETKWMSVTGAVVQARIVFDDPPTLRDAVIYDLDTDGALRAIRTAAFAAPVEKGRWALERGAVWSNLDFFTAPSASGDVPQLDRYDRQTIALTLDPVWVHNIDIRPVLLPQSVLATIAGASEGVQNGSTYRVALHERFAAIAYLVGMAILPAALAITTFLPGMGAGPMIRILVWGVGAYFASNVVLQLGSSAYLPALFAAWITPVLVVGATLLIVGLHGRRSPMRAV